MGRSSASCFKIIACGSDPDQNDHTHQPNSLPQGSSDKRGWSFRKRSARHRVLRNTAEMTSSLNNETPEIVHNSIQAQTKETIIQKTSPIPWIEETPPLTAAITKTSDTAVTSENRKLNDAKPDESAIVAIQAAVRGFLARKQMPKVKNVVKLQAVVRGHLVRSHAVGTLRCVQAIVKMQGLVRDRQARISSEAKPSDKETSDSKQHVRNISIDKLISNKFAHQLLESTSKTKSINIKCDLSSRSDSAWSWLERWMSLSSKGDALKSPSEGCESTNFKGDNIQRVVVDQNLSIYSLDNSSKNNDLEPTQPLISDSLITKEISSECVFDIIKQSHPSSVTDPKAVYNKPDMETEQPAKSVKRSAPEEVEPEGKRFAFGTRKAINPAFIAVQSKFEELNTTHSLARSAKCNKASSEAMSSSMEFKIARADDDMGENSVSHNSAVQVGGSECGTELSVTSTLDSPDGSDSELEIELKKEGGGDGIIFKKLGDEAHSGAYPESDLSNSISFQPEKLENVNFADEEKSPISEKPKIETKEFNNKINLTVEVDQQASAKSSAGASPRSQMIVPEFQGTPSSEVSVKARRTETDKSSSNQKRKSSSAGKSTSSNLNHNSGLKNSLDGFPKDLRSGKRRDSFGSGRSDYADQEPRDSSSSNSVPSYMQATESARAKAFANCSPRSSPDVQEKAVYVKKRYSIPGANGKQGSPRLQQSNSEAHRGAKTNGHPQEKKWQR